MPAMKVRSIGNGSPLTSSGVPQDLVALITGRDESLFAGDVARYRGELLERARSSRFLVVGSAGSTGSAFVRELLAFEPRGLALVDLSENALADQVRDIRSSSVAVPDDFSTTITGLGDEGFIKFLRAQQPFDVVLNFAALKHVRSERDAFSLMRMVETNVEAVSRLQATLDGRACQRFFSVSSDKAVRPNSVMGATKRWMERLIANPDLSVICTSARFANVAFSAGSLPRAFLNRLEAGQPLAAPNNIKRMFMSDQEAGHLCLLASLLGNAGETFVPRLDQTQTSVRMDEVARRVLSYHGLTPDLHDNESEAKAAAAVANGGTSWPCFFSPASSAGEKPFEELFYENEKTDLERFQAIAVAQLSPGTPEGLLGALEKLTRARVRDRWDKDEIIDAVACAVPELDHRQADRSLDDRM